jgi:hypothetical protein
MTFVDEVSGPDGLKESTPVILLALVYVYAGEDEISWAWCGFAWNLRGNSFCPTKFNIEHVFHNEMFATPGTLGKGNFTDRWSKARQVLFMLPVFRSSEKL